MILFHLPLGLLWQLIGNRGDSCGLSLRESAEERCLICRLGMRHCVVELRGNRYYLDILCTKFMVPCS
jgi:hypothetical protein